MDGAKEGRPVNGQSVCRIVESAGVPCELGGGLRSEEHIREAVAWGVDRVVVGTRALKDPGWLETIARRLPGKIILGIDAKQGRVATDGWLKVSERPAVDLARECAVWPLAAIVYTDISRDGMLEGPNFAAMGEMAAAVSLPVIAGCIIGRALYEGRIDLKEAIRMADCRL